VLFTRHGDGSGKEVLVSSYSGEEDLECGRNICCFLYTRQSIIEMFLLPSSFLALLGFSLSFTGLLKRRSFLEAASHRVVTDVRRKEDGGRQGKKRNGQLVMGTPVDE
jgi:hypothetical protein